MKITIDTRKDDPEEIKKVIQLLSGLPVRGGAKTNFKAKADMFSADKIEEIEETGTAAFASMFSSERLGENKEAGQEGGTPIDFSSLTSLIDKRKKRETDEDRPKITFF